MSEGTEKNFRKISRNFKEKIELMKRTPTKKSVKIFFELCNFGIKNYIETEMKRFPNKELKEIIIEMNEFNEKMKLRRKKKWK